jgi:nitrite reductase/ring-hydroxylating ferredoxin subunit
MEQICTWTKVGMVSDFPAGKKVPVSTNDIDVILYRDDSTWYAFERRCPHESEKLDDASILGNAVTCSQHKLVFNLTTGEVITDNGLLSLPNLKVFPVKIDGQDVLIYPNHRTVASWDWGLEM